MRTAIMYSSLRRQKMAKRKKKVNYNNNPKPAPAPGWGTPSRPQLAVEIEILSLATKFAEENKLRVETVMEFASTVYGITFNDTLEKFTEIVVKNTKKGENHEHGNDQSEPEHEDVSGENAGE